jgi:hypothetical protein
MGHPEFGEGTREKNIRAGHAAENDLLLRERENKAATMLGQIGQ